MTTRNDTMTVRRVSDDKYQGRIIKTRKGYKVILKGKPVRRTFTTPKQAAQFIADEMNTDVHYYNSLRYAKI